jgi:hypothetical protein
MRHNRELDGSIGSLLLVVGLVIFLLASIGFGAWAFTERADYKANSDEKSAAAVEAALAVQKTALEKEFDEKEKQPFETYSGPADLGSIKIVYPKTWELYVNESRTGQALIDGIAHPGYVPNITGDTSFALRYQILEADYTTVLGQYANTVKSGKLKSVPYRSEAAPNILGSRLDGQIAPTKTGSVVLLPLRDKTLKIWTEGNAFGADFNAVIASLTFVP